MRNTFSLIALASLGIAFATTHAAAGIVAVKDGYVIDGSNKHEIRGIMTGFCASDDLVFSLRDGPHRVPKFAHLGNVFDLWNANVPWKCGSQAQSNTACPDGTDRVFVQRVAGVPFTIFCLGGEHLAVRSDATKK